MLLSIAGKAINAGLNRVEKLASSLYKGAKRIIDKAEQPNLNENKMTDKPIENTVINLPKIENKLKAKNQYDKQTLYGDFDALYADTTENSIDNKLKELEKKISTKKERIDIFKRNK